MKNIKFLEHTADIKLEIFGKNLDEFLKNCLTGMAMILIGKKKILELKSSKNRIEKYIEIKFDKETLPIDFLNEVLYYSDVEKVVFFDIKNIEIKKNILKAKILGKKIESFLVCIKGVTYHSIFEKTKSGYHSIILFDV